MNLLSLRLDLTGVKTPVFRKRVEARPPTFY